MARRRVNPRTAELIRETVAQIVARRLSDPRLEMVTITAVDVAADLSVATVYYTVVAPELASSSTPRLPDAAEVAEALAGAAPRIQTLLGQRLALRRIPQLRFAPDPVAARASRVEALLKQLRDQEGGG